MRYKGNVDHNVVVDQNIVSDLSGFYQHRNMLEIRSPKIRGPQLSIMTYNIRTQCPKRRYRDGDGICYADQRYAVLAHEIGSYDADIVCLQEVEQANMYRFRQRLSKLGYQLVLSMHNSINAMAICYKRDLFTEVLWKIKHYEDSMLFSHSNNPDSHRALLLCLGFKDEFLESRLRPSKGGLIIANTHLPADTHLRLKKTEQTAALLDYISEFSKQCTADYGVSDCYTFLAGDFNSTPNDDAYMALVSKPFHFDATNTGDPSHLLKIETSHNEIPLRAVSLYSAGYHLVHPANSNINNSRNEPHFSFWGPDFQGLLDFIFVVCPWDGNDYTKADSVDELHLYSQVKLLGLLRMPRDKEMIGFLPQVGAYPSDHLCMMADVELL